MVSWRAGPPLPCRQTCRNPSWVPTASERPALAIAMLVAIFAVHVGNGLFISNDGYEFGLALLAAAVALAISGSGRVSLDAMLAARS
jgi:hypothetical protein